jgi:hypothetical protein
LDDIEYSSGVRFDELESLKTALRIKTEEHDCCAEDNIELRQKLAAMTKERDDWKYERDMMWDASTAEEFEYVELREKIATCQKREQQLREMVEILWNLLDDIDTFSDMAKSDDAAYRKMVEAKQAQRWVRTGITTDGYTLDLHLPHDTSALVEMRKERDHSRRLATEYEKGLSICEADCRKLERDAARYRFADDTVGWSVCRYVKGHGWNPVNHRDIDAAMNAAMKGTK